MQVILYRVCSAGLFLSVIFPRYLSMLAFGNEYTFLSFHLCLVIRWTTGIVMPSYLFSVLFCIKITSIIMSALYLHCLCLSLMLLIM